MTIHGYGALPSDAHNELLILVEEPRNVQKLLDQAGSDLFPREEETLRKRLDDLLRKDSRREFLNTAEHLLGNYSPSVYSGFRSFSPVKSRQMVIYCSKKIGQLSKTKLMKLLFYMDFCYFGKTGVSLSGMRYAHLPHGPAMDNWNVFLAWLEESGAIDIDITIEGWEVIRAKENCDLSVFEDSELEVLQYVSTKLGGLSAKSLSDMSHRENGYVDTNLGGVDFL